MPSLLLQPTERGRERKREVEIGASKAAENKRYAALQAQITFLFESGNILPPCPASSNDGVDQEVMRMIRVIKRVTVITSSCIDLIF